MIGHTPDPGEAHSLIQGYRRRRISTWLIGSLVVGVLVGSGVYLLQSATREGRKPEVGVQVQPSQVVPPSSHLSPALPRPMPVPLISAPGPEPASKKESAQHEEVKYSTKLKQSDLGPKSSIKPKPIGAKIFKILVDGQGRPIVLTHPRDLDFDRESAPDLSIPKLAGKSVSLIVELDEKSDLFSYNVRRYPISDSRRFWDDGILAFIRGAGWKRTDGNDYHRKFDLEITFMSTGR